MQAELAKSTALGTFMVIFTLFLPPMRNWPIWTFRESGNSNAAWAPPIAALLRFASALRQSGSRVTVAAFVVLSGLSCRDAGAYEGHTCSNGAYQYYSLWGPRPEFDKNWMPISNKNWMVTKWKQPIQIVFVDFTEGSAERASCAVKFLPKLKNSPMRPLCRSTPSFRISRLQGMLLYFFPMTSWTPI